MTLRVTQAIAAIMCNAGAAAFTAAGTAPNALLQIMSGAKPAELTTPIGAQLRLVEFTLPDDLFEDAVPTTGGATATANDIPSASALPAAGAGTTATWWRLLDKEGNVTADGTCTDTAGDGDMKLANTTIVSGIDVTIVSWTVFHPA